MTESLRTTTMVRLDVILSRLQDPNCKFDLAARVHQHEAVYNNLVVLRGLGYWDDLNTYFTRFQEYLRKRGEL